MRLIRCELYHKRREISNTRTDIKRSHKKTKTSGQRVNVWDEVSL